MFGFGRRKKKTSTEAATKAIEEAAPVAQPEAESAVPEAESHDTETLSQETKPAPATEDTAEPPRPQAEAEIPGPEVEAQAAAPAPTQEPEAVTEPKGWFARLKSRLGRTRSNLTDGLANLVLGRKTIDDELLEELETLLLTADLGVDATSRIMGELGKRVSRKELSDPAALTETLKKQLLQILENCEAPAAEPAIGKPQVILMVGINGAGKTTTIGKLAKRFQTQGKSVMLAAGDTFRAAAVEQLQTWGERNQVPVIAQHTGADAASVIYDALQAATSRGTDVLIADTAGRLHTKTNLMEELIKIVRVIKKIDPDAPHEVMLVVDATTGQNALNQALQFHEAVGLTGIALTKLDGTAKGGILFAIAERLGTPIRYIGIGEAIDDLRPFNALEFVEALFER